MYTSRRFKQLSLFVFCLFAAMQVHAQATRTWVSGVGDDANPCSRTAPCKTFAGAISKTATGGEINVLDPGGFGAVTITKSITIDGSGGSIAGVLVSGTNGIVVNAPAGSVVVLRNLDIDGLGTGINGILHNGGGDLHVENSRIYNFTGSGAGQGINFAPSTASASTANLYVSNTKFWGNTGGAIYAIPAGTVTSKVTLSDVIMQGNLRGLRIAGGVTAVSHNSVVTGNTSIAFNAGSTDGRPTSMTIDGGSVTGNGSWGVYAGTTASVYISNMVITGNGGGITAVGGSLISFGNNHVSGNSTDTAGAPTSTSGPI